MSPYRGGPPVEEPAVDLVSPYTPIHRIALLVWAASFLAPSFAGLAIALAALLLFMGRFVADAAIEFFAVRRARRLAGWR